jgi:hypothetical protein
MAGLVDDRTRHCEERSDEAIQTHRILVLDCFAFGSQ